MLSGFYSDPGEPQPIFKARKNNSLFIFRFEMRVGREISLSGNRETPSLLIYLHSL